MAKGKAPAATPSKKAANVVKKPAGKKAAPPSGQVALISALNAHTEALHRFSTVLENVRPMVVSGSGSGPLSKAAILAVLAGYFKKPDLKRGDKISTVSAGVFSTRANEINNLPAFNLKGLRLSPNDIDTIQTVGDLVDVIKGKLG